MNARIKPILIKDIQTQDLVFFDHGIEEKRYADFCQLRNIDLLPAVDSDESYYQFSKETRGFKRQEMASASKISADTYLFSPSMLSRFEASSVMFVFEYWSLTGVVHFSDYNKEVVGTYLYSVLAQYERSMRQLAHTYGLNNDHMLIYFQHSKDTATKDNSRRHFSSRIKNFNNNNQKLKRETMQPFQTFYLDDLIGLLGWKNVISLNGEVRQLRNSIMHAHDLVQMEDVATSDLVYDFASFETFFTHVQTLLHDSRRVENLIRFKQQENDEQSRK